MLLSIYDNKFVPLIFLTGRNEKPNSNRQVIALICICIITMDHSNCFNLVNLDIELKPEVVWPNAQEICSSAISSCMSVLALGLKDGVIIIWDIHNGLCYS